MLEAFYRETLNAKDNDIADMRNLIDQTTSHVNMVNSNDQASHDIFSQTQERDSER